MNTELETGVTAIDEQHKELCKRIGILLSACHERKGSEKINETLQFLDVYVKKHFTDEEQIQRISKYPKAAFHETLHRQYIKELALLKERYAKEGDSLNMVLAVNKSVVDWLTNHINKHDREFAKYYKGKKAL